MVRAARALVEGLQAVLRVIRQRGAVEDVAVFVPQRGLHGALGQVVLRLHGAVQAVIAYHRRRAVRAVKGNGTMICAIPGVGWG